MLKLTKMIGIIERCTVQYRNQEFKELELCSCHSPYIFIICNTFGLSQDEIAKILHVNKSNAARNIKYLEEKDYIKIVTDSIDKRVNHIYPTQKAYEVLPIIIKQNRAWNAILLNDFTEEEMHQLEKFLMRLVNNAQCWKEGDEVDCL